MRLDITATLAGTPDAPGKWRMGLEVRTQSGGAITQEFELTVE